MAYTSIPQTKFGDCSCGCGGINVEGRKVAKEFMCLQSYNNMKTLEQIAKAKKKNAENLAARKLRGLAYSNPDIKAGKDYQALELFFKNAAKEIAFMPQCAECGAFIPKSFYRAATAHVLPKRKEYGFPSVADNFNNWLKLGSGCGCHQRYDRSWEDAAQMKIFPLAIEKFKILYPLIDKKELKNLPEVFLQEIEPD